MDRPARKEFRRQVQAIFQDPYEAYNPVYKVDQVLTTPVRKFRLTHSREEAYQRIEESLRWPACGRKRRWDATPIS